MARGKFNFKFQSCLRRLFNSEERPLNYRITNPAAIEIQSL